ncbi:hypothetical protein LTR85_010988 [Meristemomyces frigidus]|nr:hypothetical protein LTR85_010988 [Meristemomyces frigidus]
MPTERHYWAFGIVTATVCVPFFITIGSLNTARGMHFWRRKTRAAFNSLGSLLAWIFNCGRQRAGNDNDLQDEGPGRLSMSHSISKHDNRDTRLRRGSTTQNDNVSRGSVEMKDRRQSESARPSAIRPSTLAQMWSEERQRVSKDISDV